MFKAEQELHLISTPITSSCHQLALPNPPLPKSLRKSTGFAAWTESPQLCWAELLEGSFNGRRWKEEHGKNREWGWIGEECMDKQRVGCRYTQSWKQWRKMSITLFKRQKGKSAVGGIPSGLLPWMVSLCLVVLTGIEVPLVLAFCCSVTKAS